MARQKEPKTGTRVSRRVTEEFEHEDTTDAGNNRDDNNQMERMEAPTAPDKTGSHTDTAPPAKKRPLFKRDRIFEHPRNNSQRIRTTATFRTVAARFEPNHTPETTGVNYYGASERAKDWDTS